MAPLVPWMKYLLRFVGGFNLLCGLCMIVFYSEGYAILGMQKPSAILPVQCMGILVGLFGAGYLRVSWRPVPNRDLLLLGMLSKALCGTLALYYTARGVFPWWFALVVFAVDLVYVPLFWLIWRRLCRLDEPTEDAWSAFKTPGNEGASNSGDGDDGGERRKEDKGIDARK